MLKKSCLFSIRRRRGDFPWLRHFLIVLLLVWTGRAFAHNPDTSYARVTITPQEVEFKFSYDLATLQRITKLDTNGDFQISRAELEAATPAIEQFLRAHVSSA